METKVCTKCGEEKPLDGFHRSRKMADGRQWWCKECIGANNRARRRGRVVSADRTVTLNLMDGKKVVLGVSGSGFSETEIMLAREALEALLKEGGGKDD